VTIAELRCHPVTAALHTPFVTALRRVDVVESLLVCPCRSKRQTV
jgi:hypothetical protein